MLATVRKTHARPRYDGQACPPQEYLRLPDDGFQYELIDGVMRVSASFVYRHGQAEIRFSQLLMNYLDVHPVGQAVPEVDVHLNDGLNILRPDVSFIANERLGIVGDYIYGAPDLVCEVLSPSTAQYDRGRKAELYLQHGVREYWILDPAQRAFEKRANTGRAWQNARVKSPNGAIESDILPGFTVDARQLYGSSRVTK